MRMNKDVIISVKGNQRYDDYDNDIELVTEGKYYKKGDHYYVTYKETEMTGMEGVTTTLKIGNGKIVLMRFGESNSQLIFEKGQKHVNYYETAYGAFTVGVFSNQVNIDINDSGGEVFVDYLLEINNMATSMNDFNLQIREAKKSNDKFNTTSEKSN